MKKGFVCVCVCVCVCVSRLESRLQKNKLQVGFIRYLMINWYCVHPYKWPLIIYLFILNVYLFLREAETECEWVGAEREGGTESEASSRLRAVSTEPDVGLQLTSCEIMT